MRPGEMLDIYKHPIEAIGFIIMRMLEILKRLGNQQAIEVAERALEKQEKASALKYDWEQQKTQDPVTNEGAQEIDDRIDATLTNLKKGAEVFASVERETEQKKLAEEFLDGLFADGVYPITSLPFAEQYVTVRELLRRLNGEFSEHVDRLNLRTLVDQLERLNDEFGEVLEYDIDQVEYAEVEAAYEEAEEAFHKLLIQVMCDYKDDLETFDEVIAPFREQEERTRRMLKRRANLPEIDPETGEPVEEVEETSDDDGESEGEQPN
jgi:hypothetical protein